MAVAFVGCSLKLIVGMRMLKISMGKLAAALQPPATAAALMAPVVLGLLYALAGKPPLLQLVVCSFAGIAAYLTALWWLNRETVLMAGKILRMALIHR